MLKNKQDFIQEYKTYNRNLGKFDYEIIEEVEIFFEIMRKFVKDYDGFRIPKLFRVEKKQLKPRTYKVNGKTVKKTNKRTSLKIQKSKKFDL